mgnify:CR=1 FL=1
MTARGHSISTNLDYYITVYGLKIHTKKAAIKMDVQKRIRDLMKLRGWTDYRLAKEANLSHSTVTNMFNRNNAPTLPTLEAVCRAFGITLAQFFADEVDPAQLTDEQRTLFARWSSLTERQKSLLLDLMKTM